MPVYEYRCNACAREFEYQQRMSDPEKTLCEACGKEALERLISRTAFALKGGGWYKDLYSSSKPESASKPDAAATPAAASSDSGGGSTPSTSSGGDSSSSSGSSSGTSSPSSGGSTPSGGGSKAASS
jgi:putative FmdB family regulatory protein